MFKLFQKLRKDSELEDETHEENAKCLSRGKTEKILIAALIDLMKRFVQNFNVLINFSHLFFLTSMYAMSKFLKICLNGIGENILIHFQIML